MWSKKASGRWAKFPSRDSLTLPHPPTPPPFSTFVALRGGYQKLVLKTFRSDVSRSLSNYLKNELGPKENVLRIGFRKYARKTTCS